MRKTYEDRMDANITRKDGTGFWYEVFVNCTKCGEDEKLNTEEEVKNLFYELIDEDTRDSWDAKEIELEYTWGKETISTTIYCQMNTEKAPKNGSFFRYKEIFL